MTDLEKAQQDGIATKSTSRVSRKPSGGRTSESASHKELWDRSHGCTGEIEAQWSGIKCSKCAGWLCI